MAKMGASNMRVRKMPGGEFTLENGGHEPDSEGPIEPARFVEGYLAFLLAHVSNRISREFHREVASAGLSVTEWRVLASLIGSAGETIGSLSQLALTKQPTLSKVVQRMERDNLVTRRTIRSDRRQTVVCMTPRGQALSESLQQRAIEHQVAVLGPFGDHRGELLIQMLHQLLALHSDTEISDFPDPDD